MTADELAPAPDADLPRPAAPVARWEDYIDIFYAPAEVFRRRTGQGAMLPFLAVSLMMGIITYAMFDSLRPLMEAAMAKSGAGLPSEAQGGSLSETMVGVGKVFAVVGTAIMLGMLGIFTWIVGKIFGSQQELSDAYMVVSYAFLPRVVAALVSAVILLVSGKTITDANQLSFSLARFLTPDPMSPMFVLASKIEVFQLWSLVLIAIGLAVTGRTSRTRAIIATVVVWAVPTLFQVGSVMMSQALLGSMK
jgi:hypothetical protein